MTTVAILELPAMAIREVLGMAILGLKLNTTHIKHKWCSRRQPTTLTGSQARDA